MLLFLLTTKPSVTINTIFYLFSTVFGFKILGFPARIEDNAYARNAYYFNLCFVFDAWARSVHYEPVIKKLTDYLVKFNSFTRLWIENSLTIV